MFKFECDCANIIGSEHAHDNYIATETSTCPQNGVNSSKIRKNERITKVNSVVAILTEQFLPFIDHNENFFPLLQHILFISAATQRPRILRRMNRTINCRAPGEIYGWPCDGMKSLIFLSAPRPEFQTWSWLKKYRMTRGSYTMAVVAAATGGTIYYCETLI